MSLAFWKKGKRPKIYDEFFNIVADDSTSKLWAKVSINVVFIEMLISSTISVQIHNL
jgi:hypothetical protein